ncbi:MAG: tryptophan synthase subunit alpha [Alphaproteobacteria bacterium]|nr:tryptophan synthase subunit alpha [Alphaproteobacteria bacterium]
MSRIARCFEDVRKRGTSAFIPFVTACDPDVETSFGILQRLPAAGADIIELGIPFSDPMADGPINQASYLRALSGGATLQSVLDLVRRFRSTDSKTPLVLMGSYNPVHAFGTERFASAASGAGVDGLLLVDLPAEEDQVLRIPARVHGLDIIRLIAPTTDDHRLRKILPGSTGYLYYASVTGITGTKPVVVNDVKASLARIRATTELPVAVGFGIRAPEEAENIARIADAVVVGSAIVSGIAKDVSAALSSHQVIENTVQFCAGLAKAVHAARRGNVVR